MSDYRIEAAAKEEWATRALNAEARNKELTLQLLATSGQAADALDKLTKAVEALRFLSEATTVPEANICITRALTDARTVLAELEGKPNE
jgi:hypothetical protein